MITPYIINKLTLHLNEVSAYLLLVTVLIPNLFYFINTGRRNINN